MAKKFQFLFGVVFVVVASVLFTNALDNGVGKTPPMGWSSWNVFAGDIDEGKIMQTIDSMAKLTSFGYEYVNLDDNWMLPTRDKNGNLQPRLDKFPNGIKPLADYAHSKGLKLGIYSAHGARTCMGNAASGGDTPHYQQDAQLFASWGIDYLKFDSCGGYEKNYTEVAGQYKNYADMRDALNATGRPIYYSICEIITVPTNRTVAFESPSRCKRTSSYNVLDWASQSNLYDPTQLANSYLIEWANNKNTFNDRNCSGWLNNLDAQQDLTLDELSGPGNWNDNDMLTVGCNGDADGHTPCHGNETLIEQQAQFALWCMQASPLILGNDVRSMTPEVLNILTNPELIAINQDPLGHRAAVAWQSDVRTRSQQIFVKQMSDATKPRAASLFNREDTAATISLTRAMLNLGANECNCLQFRDVDLHKTVKTNVTASGIVFQQSILPHQALTLRVECC